MFRRPDTSLVPGHPLSEVYKGLLWGLGRQLWLSGAPWSCLGTLLRVHGVSSMLECALLGSGMHSVVVDIRLEISVPSLSISRDGSRDSSLVLPGAFK